MVFVKAAEDEYDRRKTMLKRLLCDRSGQLRVPPYVNPMSLKETGEEVVQKIFSADSDNKLREQIVLAALAISRARHPHTMIPIVDAVTGAVPRLKDSDTALQSKESDATFAKCCRIVLRSVREPAFSRLDDPQCAEGAREVRPLDQEVYPARSAAACGVLATFWRLCVLQIVDRELRHEMATEAKKVSVETSPLYAEAVGILPCPPKLNVMHGGGQYRTGGVESSRRPFESPWGQARLVLAASNG